MYNGLKYTKNLQIMNMHNINTESCNKTIFKTVCLMCKKYNKAPVMLQGIITGPKEW